MSELKSAIVFEPATAKEEDQLEIAIQKYIDFFGEEPGETSDE